MKTKKETWLDSYAEAFSSLQTLQPGESIRFMTHQPRLDNSQLLNLGLVPTQVPQLMDWPRRLLKRAIAHEATKPLSLDECRLSEEESAFAHALEMHGRAQFLAKGGSMRPLIPNQSLVEIELLDPHTEPELGQIILIGQPGRTLLHRLVRILNTSRGRAFICRGDRVRHFDRPVWRDALLGIYTGHR
jgi:hypothetical protein